jgi:large subunit ribosomal protein L23
MHPYEILIRPLITEKTQWQVGYEKPQYSFEVDGRANKSQIAEAVEVAFNVKVERVAVINMPAKRRRSPRSSTRGRKAAHIQRSGQWKKAIVQVAEGNRIGLFEGVA